MSTKNVIAVEYGAEDRPFSIFTREGGVSLWDADWCKRDETLYVHESGVGGSVYFNALSEGARNKAWVAPGERITTTRETSPGKWATVEITREEVATLGFDLLDELPGDPFDGAEESDTVWCDVCEDHLPTENTDSPCDHTTWCDLSGWWVSIKDQQHVFDGGEPHDICEECG